MSVEIPNPASGLDLKRAGLIAMGLTAGTGFAHTDTEFKRRLCGICVEQRRLGLS